MASLSGGKRGGRLSSESTGRITKSSSRASSGKKNSILNKYTNDPNYVVERDSKGNIKKVYQKEKQYKKFISGNQIKQTGTYSPHTLTVDEQGNIVEEYEDIYQKFFSPRSGEEKKDVYTTRKMVYNPEGALIKRIDWGQYSDQGKNTVRGKIKKEEVRTYTPDSGVPKTQEVTTFEERDIGGKKRVVKTGKKRVTQEGRESGYYFPKGTTRREKLSEEKDFKQDLINKGVWQPRKSKIRREGSNLLFSSNVPDTSRFWREGDKLVDTGGGVFAVEGTPSAERRTQTISQSFSPVTGLQRPELKLDIIKTKLPSVETAPPIIGDVNAEDKGEIIYPKQGPTPTKEDILKAKGYLQTLKDKGEIWGTFEYDIPREGLKEAEEEQKEIIQQQNKLQKEKEQLRQEYEKLGIPTETFTNNPQLMLLTSADGDKVVGYENTNTQKTVMFPTALSWGAVEQLNEKAKQLNQKIEEQQKDILEYRERLAPVEEQLRKRQQAMEKEQAVLDQKWKDIQDKFYTTKVQFEETPAEGGSTQPQYVQVRTGDDKEFNRAVAEYNRLAERYTKKFYPMKKFNLTAPKEILQQPVQLKTNATKLEEINDLISSGQFKITDENVKDVEKILQESGVLQRQLREVDTTYEKLGGIPLPEFALREKQNVEFSELQRNLQNYYDKRWGKTAAVTLGTLVATAGAGEIIGALSKTPIITKLGKLPVIGQLGRAATSPTAQKVLYGGYVTTTGLGAGRDIQKQDYFGAGSKALQVAAVTGGISWLKGKGGKPISSLLKDTRGTIIDYRQTAPFKYKPGSMEERLAKRIFTTDMSSRVNPKFTYTQTKGLSFPQRTLAGTTSIPTRRDLNTRYRLLTKQRNVIVQDKSIPTKTRRQLLSQIDKEMRANERLRIKLAQEQGENVMVGGTTENLEIQTLKSRVPQKTGTTQQKLAQFGDQLYAVNKLNPAERALVKIMNGVPYRYDYRIGKYVEFDKNVWGLVNLPKYLSQYGMETIPEGVKAQARMKLKPGEEIQFMLGDKYSYVGKDVIPKQSVLTEYGIKPPLTQQYTEGGGIILTKSPPKTKQTFYPNMGDIIRASPSTVVPSVTPSPPKNTISDVEKLNMYRKSSSGKSLSSQIGKYDPYGISKQTGITYTVPTRPQGRYGIQPTAERTTIKPTTFTSLTTNIRPIYSIYPATKLAEKLKTDVNVIPKTFAIPKLKSSPSQKTLSQLEGRQVGILGRKFVPQPKYDLISDVRTISSPITTPTISGGLSMQNIQTPIPPPTIPVPTTPTTSPTIPPPSTINKLPLLLGGFGGKLGKGERFNPGKGLRTWMVNNPILTPKEFFYGKDKIREILK